MSHMLKPGDIVRTETKSICTVEIFLGGGGQGEVYKAKLDDASVALKWYFPHYLQQDERLRERLDMVIKAGRPSNRFLWPFALVSKPDSTQEFGYVMPLREARFKGIVDLMKRRVEPSFRTLARVGFELAHNYYQLHARGLCYRDISFGNVFFDPDTGEVRICDNDNVDVNGQPGTISGTPRFMAPELVRGQATPSRQTDLFSLAVLLFYIFMVHHPLEGEKELQIHSLDLASMRKLYGEEPIFIFDPEDDSNRPVPGYHDNALEFWTIYPKFLRNRFTQAFTKGIRDPQHGRVAETIWRADLARLYDSVVYCATCGRENFYDAARLKMSKDEPGLCWGCDTQIKLPPRIRIGKRIVMLNHDAKLFRHHIADPVTDYDFSQPVAEVSQHPQHPQIWGLKNLSDKKWVSTNIENKMSDVLPGQSVTLANGTRINFGSSEGKIRQ